jgi:hypothetical protein
LSQRGIVRILLSYENFEVFGGTETYIRTVSLELLRLGHDAIIYAPNGGHVADLARDQGMGVVTRDQLPRDCHAVLSNDAATAHELAGRFPDAVHIYIAHSRDGTQQEPPQLAGVCDAAVVLNDRVRRWVEARASHPPLLRLRQPITMERYRQTRPPSTPARRALVSSNYVEGPRAAIITQACLRAGLELDWIGATTTATATPERDLAAADIVIGLGRSILEAMAAGRAAYVYGVVGGDGWVTPETYPALEADGFAGMVSQIPMTASRMASELCEYAPDMGEANRDLVSLHHGARTHAVELVELIAQYSKRSQAGEGQRPVSPGATDSKPAAGAEVSALDEISRLLRLEWEMRVRALQSAAHADDMRADRDRQRAGALDAIARVGVLDGELQDARRRVAELEAGLRAAEALVAQRDRQLRDIVTTRRYRLGAALARPFDMTRARLRRSGAGT